MGTDCQVKVSMALRPSMEELSWGAEAAVGGVTLRPQKATIYSRVMALYFSSYFGCRRR